MPISFNHIPANWKMPLYWVEVDPSKAGLPTNVKPSLLVGMLNGSGVGAIKGTALPNIMIPIASQAQADQAFGQGSHLASMFRAYFANNWAGQVYGLPLAEGSSPASGTVTISTPPTAAGQIDLYIAGYNVPVAVGATDIVGTVATNMAAAINLATQVPVTATAAGSVVTVTCKFKGTSGNDIKLQDSYYGSIGGEQLPPGITLTYAQPAGGAGDPVSTTAISNLGEAEVEYVCMPFTDSTNMNAWELEFGFSDTGRWGFIREHFGHLFNCKRDTMANLLAFGPSRNSPQHSVLGIEVLCPSPTWEWAAAYTAKAARALLNDPARPLQSLHLETILPPATGQVRFLLSELNALAGAGIATQRALSSDNLPMLLRETTTYVRNAYGIGDDAYELVTTLATLAQILRNQRQAITSKYPRHKLADDGTRFGAGQAIVTPKTIKAELVAQYRIDEFNGLVENATAFKNNLIVERDPNDPNRVNVLYPPDLVNQLRVFAVLAQFRLQYNRGVDIAIA
jgi:phage tail sheath gpL-like